MFGSCLKYTFDFIISLLRYYAVGISIISKLFSPFNMVILGFIFNQLELFTIVVDIWFQQCHRCEDEGETMREKLTDGDKTRQSYFACIEDNSCIFVSFEYLHQISIYIVEICKQSLVSK